MQPLFDALVTARPNGSVIQIGFNDDWDRAPVRGLFEARGWNALLVEPLPSLFQRLAGWYQGRPNVRLDDVALATTTGEQPFYYLIDTRADRSGTSHPTGSLRRERLLWFRHVLTDFEERLVETKVETLPFEKLCQRHELTQCDVLALDTDGSDYAIIRQVDLSRWRPIIVVARTAHLVRGAHDAYVRELHGCGYAILEHGEDTWALSTAALSADCARRLTGIWRWLAGTKDPSQPLRITRAALETAHRIVTAPKPSSDVTFPMTDADRRYFEQGYDDRTPLPSDAADYLCESNVRLAELRTAYAALDVPAVDHHVWSPDRVSSLVTLRYFRGDNLYVWHYPEHPRAMALTLATYLRYVEDTAPPELLQKLSEDGAFGCWTVDIKGFGKVSRDLLDSINEISFLDRHLGLCARDSVRVLDIGAGYGRMAHRLTVALPAVSDYCCVDAVPESTFLSEYYLRFRGVTPTARVLGLHELDASLTPGGFDLAVNIHSFSECTLAAIEWWLALVRRLEVPYLFVVPNEAEGIVSREVDGDCLDALPCFTAAGYQPVRVEPAILDPRARELLRINDNHWLFARADPTDAGLPSVSSGGR
jgi:FkbM family methyltransferase